MHRTFLNTNDGDSFFVDFGLLAACIVGRIASKWLLNKSLEPSMFARIAQHNIYIQLFSSPFSLQQVS